LEGGEKLKGEERRGELVVFIPLPKKKKRKTEEGREGGGLPAFM